MTLFDARLRTAPFWPQYAVTKDASKVLLNLSVGEEGTRPMTLVQNRASSLTH